LVSLSCSILTSKVWSLQDSQADSERKVEDHRVGSEWYRVSKASANTINAAKRRNAKIVAVGTSVVRTLETVSKQTRVGSRVQSGEGWTELFIYPGYKFQTVTAILTNLHEPRSSHLLLVAAFAGKEPTLGTYRQLVKDNYRFDLFGDSMMVI
jgi:S-adenosylmethionine:tRNA ribosyltransferase-isomerase